MLLISNYNDKELLDLLQKTSNGDMSAANLLLKEIAMAGYAACLKHTKKKEDAEDLWQESLTKISSGIENFYNVKNNCTDACVKRFVKWTTTIIHRTFIDLFINRKKIDKEYPRYFGNKNIDALRDESEVNEAADEAAKDKFMNQAPGRIDSDYEAETVNEKLSKCVASLEEEQRYIIRQRFLLDKKQNVISERLKKSEGEISKQIKKAINSLKKCLSIYGITKITLYG